MLHTMMLNEPLARTARAPLTDVYDCSEHFHTTWCRGHPGKSPDLNFDYLARRADAVETGRPKLVVLMTKHVDDLKLAGRKE